MVELYVDNKRNQQKNGSFIALACGFKSDVTAVIAGEAINAKSIMRSPAIEKAEELKFILNGEDEKEAAEAIFAYFISK